MLKKFKSKDGEEDLEEYIQKLADKTQFIEKNLVKLGSIVKSLKTKIEQNHEEIQKTVKLQTERLDKAIETQREVLLSMIEKNKKGISGFKTEANGELDSLRRDIDTFKISLNVNENRLIQKIKELISLELGNAVKGKENEVLMSLWIKELKSIIRDFDKLKKLHPKQFSLRLKEISDTIDIFKQQLKPI